MSTSSRRNGTLRSRVAVLLGCGLSVLALVRCAPGSTCTRISDCDLGMTCMAGSCVTALASVDSEGGSASSEGGSASSEASSAAPTDANTSTDTSAIGDGATADESDGGEPDDGGGDAYIDTSDF